MDFLKNLNISSKLNLDDLYNTYLSFEKKQQVVVGIIAGILLLLVLFVPVSCVSSKLNEKEEVYTKYAKKASQLFGVLNEIKELETSIGNIKAGSKLGSDPLKKVLYTVTDDIGIERQKIVPKTSNIPSTDKLFAEIGKDVEIKNVLFSQTIELLDKLVHNDDLPVNLKKLKIKVDQKNKQVMKSVSFTMTTIQAKDK